MVTTQRSARFPATSHPRRWLVSWSRPCPHQPLPGVGQLRASTHPEAVPLVPLPSLFLAASRSRWDPWSPVSDFQDAPPRTHALSCISGLVASPIWRATATLDAAEPIATGRPSRALFSNNPLPQGFPRLRLRLRLPEDSQPTSEHGVKVLPQRPSQHSAETAMLSTGRCLLRLRLLLRLLSRSSFRQQESLKQLVGQPRQVNLLRDMPNAQPSCLSFSFSGRGPLSGLPRKNHPRSVARCKRKPAFKCPGWTFLIGKGPRRLPGAALPLRFKVKGASSFVFSSSSPSFFSSLFFQQGSVGSQKRDSFHLACWM